MPQAQDNDAETPKTEEGEDLGVGEGWWHTGIFIQIANGIPAQLTYLQSWVSVLRSALGLK